MMLISVPGKSKRRGRGFTLIELLVVLVIIGVTLGLTVVSVAPSQAKAMQKDAQRLALLLQLARDEAIVRNRPVAFEAGPDSYRFLVRNEKSWEPLPQDDMLRERPFELAPVTLLLDPATNVPGNMRIVFGREPVDRPFALTLISGELRGTIRADGVGHFTVD
ncbi:GspH/FimT family pseudopilin [Pseudoduganella violaceinigra]|uniref:GspH/FimT family pseudopilin n=1 Tax=Pseudoduganella violaceinigra TaxID=246602 RepID=UPI001E36043A|nr:GspH/FimT family pseudopilin [Pseudoduganella violaceinigra]